PIFCPAIADSSIGMGLSQARQKTAGAGQIDIIGDIVESANLIIRRPRTASIVLGGGTPKNFINQASVQAEFYSPEVSGHRYALQVVTDVPHFGGASGSSLEEAPSWGKLAADSGRVSVQADATIALPLLASALVTTAASLAAARKRPIFSLASRLMTIDGQAVPNNRFEEVNESAV
ncbi:MAG: deoxyhypusine synthase, partial [Acidobacteria bacterium]